MDCELSLLLELLLVLWLLELVEIELELVEIELLLELLVEIELLELWLLELSSSMERTIRWASLPLCLLKVRSPVLNSRVTAGRVSPPRVSTNLACQTVLAARVTSTYSTAPASASWAAAGALSSPARWPRVMVN